MYCSVLAYVVACGRKRKGGGEGRVGGEEGTERQSWERGGQEIERVCMSRLCVCMQVYVRICD